MPKIENIIIDVLLFKEKAEVKFELSIFTITVEFNEVRFLHSCAYTEKLGQEHGLFESEQINPLGTVLKL